MKAELSSEQIDNIKTWAVDAFERAEFECRQRKDRKEVQGNWLAIKTLSANILKTLGAPLPGVTVAPWRKVISHNRAWNGSVQNTLECGHKSKTFYGDAALDAQRAKKHRCAECGNINEKTPH